MKCEMNAFIKTSLIIDLSVMPPKLTHNTLRKHMLTGSHLIIINMFIYISNHNYNVFEYLKHKPHHNFPALT